MNNIQVFIHELFGDIRTMTNEKGETFFVGKDVASALGYKNANKALADHVSEDDLTKRYPIFDNMGRKQQAIFINESGLYSLVLSSKICATVHGHNEFAARACPCFDVRGWLKEEKII